MGSPDRRPVIEWLKSLPDPLWAEVVEFVEFLRWRHQVPETALLSEGTLAPGWMGPEEDEVWKTL
jgi:hypothetical protein